MAHQRFSYGAWHGGPDPLEPPYDIREALDDIGDERAAPWLSPTRGAEPHAAPRSNGVTDPDWTPCGAGLAKRACRELPASGRLDGTLEQVRELLDQAIEAERRALFPDPDDSARMAEAELDNLPSDTSRAVRELADYQWRSAQARQAYEQIEELLREQVLDAQFAGMREAMQNATPQDLERIRQMMSALNDMLDADARGEHTDEDFARFMERVRRLLPRTARQSGRADRRHRPPALPRPPG